MPPTFNALTLNPEGLCSVCNRSGETLVETVTGLQLCQDDVMVVARARTGQRGPAPVRKNGKRASKRNNPSGESTPEDLPVSQSWCESTSQSTGISDQHSESRSATPKI